MFTVSLTHSNPSVGTPFNKHSWVKEFNTLTEAMNYLKDDIVTNSNVFESVTIIKN